MASSIEQLKGAIAGGAARANRYKVILPSRFGADPNTSNILCRATNVPGRQILTNDRNIGMITQKMPYAFLSEDVNMTFLLTNDYSMRTYFEAWQQAIVGFDTYELNYKSDYAQDVISQQLNHGDNSVVYACKLLRAFPTTMQAVELGDDATNQIVQLNVQLSYTVWEPA